MSEWKSILLLPAVCLLLFCAFVYAGTYEYAGTHHNSGDKENDWNSAASWANGPADYPDATGDVARTAANVAGDVWLYLNQDITVGDIQWEGNQLFLYPGTPGGRLTVADNDGQVFWQVSTPYRFKIYADMILAGDLVVSNTCTRETELDGIVSGPGKLTLIWNQSQASDGYEFLLGEAGTAANTYAGGTELITVRDGIRGEFRARKNGVFGSGDVIVQPKATLVLNDIGATDDMISNSATLRLNENDGMYAVLQLSGGVNETVDRLVLGGVEQFPGTYGAAGSGAQVINDCYFSATGILTVVSGPPVPGGLSNGAGATVITPTNVVLNGILLFTNHSPTYVFMYWGSFDGGASTSAWENELALGPRSPGAFSAYIGGATPGQTLFYTCCITNVLGDLWATPSVQFKLYGPPEVVNDRAVLYADSVKLRGTVQDTNGYPTTARFYWGTADGRTNRGAWDHTLAVGPVTNGPVTRVVSNLTAYTPYYYRVYATNSFGETWAESTASFIAPGTPATNDITFFCISDIHYGLTPEVDALAPEMVDRMNELPGTAWPPGLEAGTVQPPRGIVIAGDIASNSREDEWALFIRDYGVHGEARLAYPVYEGFGNHDAGEYVAEQMKNRTAQRHGLSRISANGYHYSWDWDYLHLIHLNVSPGLTYHPYDPRFSYTFLTNDLAISVGESDRPIIIFHHFGYASTASWWPAQDRTNFFNAIALYNVIAVVHGHAHDNGFYTRDNVRICNTPHMQANIDATPAHGFLAFHISSNTLRVATRTSDDTWDVTLLENIQIPEPGVLLYLIAAGTAFGIHRKLRHIE